MFLFGAMKKQFVFFFWVECCDCFELLRFLWIKHNIKENYITQGFSPAQKNRKNLLTYGPTTVWKTGALRGHFDADARVNQGDQGSLPGALQLDEEIAGMQITWGICGKVSHLDENKPKKNQVMMVFLCFFFFFNSEKNNTSQPIQVTMQKAVLQSHFGLGLMLSVNWTCHVSFARAPSCRSKPNGLPDLARFAFCFKW